MYEIITKIKKIQAKKEVTEQVQETFGSLGGIQAPCPASSLAPYGIDQGIYLLTYLLT